jgi:superfamily II DNA or RNA helicase
VAQKIELRDYQKDWISRVCQSLANHRAVLGVLPTGAGKTVCFSHIAQAWPGRVLVVVHRQELLGQAWRALYSLGIVADMIAPEAVSSGIGWRVPGARIAVGSAQSLDMDALSQYSLIIIDEAHHTIAEQWSAVCRAAPDAKILGVTATPCRADDRGLGEIYHAIVLGPSVSDLMRLGHLCTAAYWVPPEILESGHMVDRAIEMYRKHGMGMQGVYFARSVEDAIQSAAAFSAAGIPARALYGAMPANERSEVVAELAAGRLRFVMSKDLISEGFDCPNLGVAILARRTESQGLHMQQIGRVLRPSAGKVEAVVIDLVGNCLRLGIAEEEREWSLSGVKRRPPNPDDMGLSYRKCKRCGCYHMSAPACPRCGLVYPVKKQRMIMLGGELVPYSPESAELQRKERKKEEQSCRVLADWIDLGRKRGHAPGWAHVRYNIRKKRWGTPR